MMSSDEGRVSPIAVEVLRGLAEVPGEWVPPSKPAVLADLWRSRLVDRREVPDKTPSGRSAKRKVYRITEAGLRFVAARSATIAPR